MASAEERMQILRMIEEGKITAGEGAELLRALDKSDRRQQTEPLKGSSAPRWFRVRVTDMATGRTKVNVNLPLSLVKAGMKMGARFAPDMEELDWEELAIAIQEGAAGKIVEVEDEEDGERVEVYVE